MAFGDIVQSVENDVDGATSISVGSSHGWSVATDGNLVVVIHMFADNTNTRTSEPSPGNPTYERDVDNTQANPDTHFKAWWGIASSEPSSYTVQTSANEDGAMIAVEIEGPFVDNANPGHADNHVSEASTGSGEEATHTFSSVTTTVASSILIALIGFNQNNNNVASWTNSFVERVETAGAGNIFQNAAVATRLVSSTGTYDTETTSSVNASACMILLGLAQGASDPPKLVGRTLHYDFPNKLLDIDSGV